LFTFSPVNYCKNTVSTSLFAPVAPLVKIMFKMFLKDENGATAIEYGLIASLIGMTLVGAITAIGTNTTVTMVNVTGYF